VKTVATNPGNDEMEKELRESCGKNWVSKRRAGLQSSTAKTGCLAKIPGFLPDKWAEIGDFYPNPNFRRSSKKA
jgi:hypothetical protein